MDSAGINEQTAANASSVDDQSRPLDHRRSPAPDNVTDQVDLETVSSLQRYVEAFCFTPESHASRLPAGFGRLQSLRRRRTQAPGPRSRPSHTTLIQGADVSTGVTAVLPHGRNLFQEKVAGAVFVGNPFGKLAGSTQVQELGTIETPIVLTNTLSVGTAVEAVVSWTLAQLGNEKVGSSSAVIALASSSKLISAAF
jgi:hypothetical protein